LTAGCRLNSPGNPGASWLLFARLGMHETLLPPVALGHEEIFLSFLDSGTERTRRCLVCAHAKRPQGARHEMNFQERVNTLSLFA
jgi:hypothetical protein